MAGEKIACVDFISRFVDRASLYNLVNKANLVHNFFLVGLFLFSTCFGRLCAHQEKQLYLCGTWYLLFCMDDCLICRSMNVWYARAYASAYQVANHTGDKYQVSHKYSCFS